MDREEAIEVYRGLLNEKIKEAFEFFVPELAESEDERIRLFIYDLITRIFWGINWDISKKDCLAYLEKQKEQNLIMAKSPQLKEQKPWKVGENAYFTPDKETPIAEQEQKPIKWDELTWKDIVKLEGIINNVHYEFRNGIGQESFGKEVLEKFREYKGDEYLDEKEQKPAEWSEEDEETREEVIGDLCALKDWIIKFDTNWLANPVLKNIDKRMDWLKNLHSNLKKKNEDVTKLCSNEWSEEDRLHYANILEALEYVKGCKSDYTKIEAVKSDIAWFKSLRPTKDCNGCPKHLEGYISGRSDAENKLLDMYGILLMPDGELRMKPKLKPSDEQMEETIEGKALELYPVKYLDEHRGERKHSDLNHAQRKAWIEGVKYGLELAKKKE